MRSSYKTWRPDTAHYTPSATKQKQIAQLNAQWGTGPEGPKYDSNEGMRSSSYAVVWTFLGILGRGIPVTPSEEKKQDLHNFLLLIGKLLPCKTCRTHFQKNLVDAGYDPSIHLASRQAFSRFINHLHNIVNQMLKKPTWTYENHRDTFETLRAKCTKHGCTGQTTVDDVKATCVVTFLPEADTNKFVHSSLAFSAECALPLFSSTKSKRRSKNVNTTKKKKSYISPRAKSTRKRSKRGTRGRRERRKG